MNNNNCNSSNQCTAEQNQIINHNLSKQNTIVFNNGKQNRKQEESRFDVSVLKSDPRKRTLQNFLEQYFWDALQQTQIDTLKQEKQQQSDQIIHLKEILKQNEEIRDFSSFEYKFLMEEKQALETLLQASNAEVQKYRDTNCEVLRGHCERYRMQRNQVAENLQKAEAELDKVNNSYNNLKNQVRKIIQNLGNSEQGILSQSQDYELLKKLVS